MDNQEVDNRPTGKEVNDAWRDGYAEGKKAGWDAGYERGYRVGYAQMALEAAQKED